VESFFGDMRLDKRLEHLTEQLSAKPFATLPQSLTAWSSLKAGYRFLNNEHVSHEAIVATEKKSTARRLVAYGRELILAVQDTTSFNFSGRKALQGVGVLDNNITAGLFAHTTLAVSQEGVPLGLLNQQVWSRAENPARIDAEHRQKPITEKESFKWLHSVQHLPDMPQDVVTICDREGDIYELFQEAHNQNLGFIVRSAWNRRLEDASGFKLHDFLEKVPVKETYNLTVQRQMNQAERQAQMTLRYTTVTLSPPLNRPASARTMTLDPLPVQIVVAEEVDSPVDVKAPIKWVLITNLMVDSIEDAYRMVRFYSYRWLVERFHYILKSGGCKFEDSQLRSVEALYRLLGLCSRVAWRLLWMTYQARQTPQASCTVALSPVEWQALTAFINKTPTAAHSPPTLQQAVRMIAKLGGFIGRKSDGEPGVKTLWRGWQRLQDIVATWKLFHDPQDMGND